MNYQLLITHYSFEVNKNRSVLKKILDNCMKDKKTVEAVIAPPPPHMVGDGFF